jgi:hypothetical protein
MVLSRRCVRAIVCGKTDPTYRSAQSAQDQLRRAASSGAEVLGGGFAGLPALLRVAR